MGDSSRTALELESAAEADVTGLLSYADSTEDSLADNTRPGPSLNWQSPFLIGFAGVIGVLVGYGLLQSLLKLSSIGLYIVVALFLSLGLEPMVNLLVRRGLARGWSVLAVITAVGVVGGLLAWMILPPIITQVIALVNSVPGYLNELQHTWWMQEIQERLQLNDRLLDNLGDSINQETVTSLFGGVLDAGKAFADAIVAIFTVVVLTIYFVAAMPKVKTAAYKLVPHSRRPRVIYLSEAITLRVGRYLIGQVFVAIINGLFAYAILMILDLPFPAVLATLIGLLAMIPIAGTLIGGVIITLVAFSQGWIAALIVLGYYILYHLVETYLIIPRIMERAVAVPPVITIVAVLAGGTLLGIIGALIAIPVAAGLQLLYHEVAVPRQQRS